MYKVYGKIPLFILIGRICLSLAEHKVLMECQSSLIIIILICQISSISPLILSNHELKSSCCCVREPETNFGLFVTIAKEVYCSLIYMYTCIEVAHALFTGHLNKYYLLIR